MFLSLIAAVTAQAPAYGPCDVKNYKYSSIEGKGFPIQSVLTNGQVTISGEAYIVNGCRIGLRNFVFFNGGESYWYGGVKGSIDAITMSDQFVQPSAFPANFTYDLTQRAGAQANFNGINQLRLFAKNLNLIIATVDLPDVASPTNSNGGAAPTNSNGGSTSSSPKANAAWNEAGTVGTIAGAILALLFA